MEKKTIIKSEDILQYIEYIKNIIKNQNGRLLFNLDEIAFDFRVDDR